METILRPNYKLKSQFGDKTSYPLVPLRGSIMSLWLLLVLRPRKTFIFILFDDKETIYWWVGSHCKRLRKSFMLKLRFLERLVKF